MKMHLLLLLWLVSGYLVSVVKLEYPPSSTPLSKFSWSLQEDQSSLTDLGKIQIQKAANSFISFYEDLFKNQGSLTIHSKSTPVSTSSALVFAEQSGLEYNIITNIFSEDYLLSPDTSCPRIFWLQTRDRLESKAFTQFWDTLLPHLEKFSSVIGDEASPYNIHLLGDTIISYRERGISLPEILDEESRELAVAGYYRYNDLLLYGSKEQGKLATHAFFNYLIELMNSRSMSEGVVIMPDSALFYAINKMLGFESSNSSLAIEIHSDSVRYFKFRRGEDYVEMPGCEGVCIIETFSGIMEKRMYKSDKAHRYACAVIGDPPTSWKEYGIYGLGVFAVFAIFMCNTKAAVWAAKKFKEHSQ